MSAPTIPELLELIRRKDEALRNALKNHSRPFGGFITNLEEIHQALALTPEGITEAVKDRENAFQGLLVLALTAARKDRKVTIKEIDYFADAYRRTMPIAIAPEAVRGEGGELRDLKDQIIEFARMFESGALAADEKTRSRE